MATDDLKALEQQALADLAQAGDETRLREWNTKYFGDSGLMKAAMGQLAKLPKDQKAAYGAEANRDGPPEEKGTYAFQNEFIQYHLDVFASKPWLAGSVYWALQEFRVKPYWGGGNPWPTAPVHTKGLVRLDWTKKQGFPVLRNGIRKLRQFVPESAAR